MHRKPERVGRGRDLCVQPSDVQAAVTLFGISNLLNIGEGFSPTVQLMQQSPVVTEALLVTGPAFRHFAVATCPGFSSP